MAYSKIVLTFSRKIVAGEYIRFTVDNSYATGIVNAYETAAIARSTSGEFDAEPTIDWSIDKYNYAYAFNLDFNTTSLYLISYSGNDVTITARNPNVTFSGFTSNAGVTSVITNEAIISDLNITSVTFSAELIKAYQCSHVQVTVTCDDVMTDITSPITVTGNATNSYTFRYAKGKSFFLSVNNGTTTDSQTVTTPAILLTPNPIVSYTPTKAIVTVEEQSATITNYLLSSASLSYSVAQASNIFTNLDPADDYNIAVYDGYACSQDLDFEIVAIPTEASTPTIPYHFISNSQSLRFKKDEVWDYKTIYKTDENTLSCEENCPLVYTYLQRYQSEDDITVQFRSNFDTLVAKGVDKDGNETAFTITKKTNNLGREDSRDALGISYDDGSYGFYFMDGNTYDYTTGLANGTYDLNGDLPGFAKVGQFILVDGTNYYEITEITYDYDLSAWVCMIGVDLSGGPENVVISAKYNAFNFEVYEFEINMFDFLDKYFDVIIEMSDTNFDSVSFTSERCYVSDLFDDLIELRASNTVNTEIVYLTGIEHKVRLDWDYFGSATENDTEIHKTDNKVYTLKSNTYGKKQLELPYLTTKKADSIVELLTLNTIFINGKQFTVESIDEPKRTGISNHYKVVAKLYETGDDYISTALKIEDLTTPDLVDSGDGLVSQ